MFGRKLYMHWAAMVIGVGGLIFAAIAGSVEASGGQGHANGAPHGNADQIARTPQSVEFRDQMRKLWEDHITWTRLVIVSMAADLPDAAPTTQRLLDNQTDIGNAIKPFYGEAAGDQLTALLRDHIITAADIITAAKAGDTAGVSSSEARWYANANDIAAFLHHANPDQWPLADLQSMMRTHLDLTLDEAVNRLQGDFARDIAAYDQVHAEILQMADMLSLGIIHEFPGNFR